MLNSVTFNHDADTISLALGIEKDQSQMIRHIILYETIKRYLMLNGELFESEDEAPESIKSITFLMEKCIKYAKTDNEQCYMIFIFQEGEKYGSNIIEAKNRIEEINKTSIKKSSQTDPEDIGKMIVDAINKKFEKAILDYKVEDQMDVLSYFDIVKKSSSFEEYYSLYKSYTEDDDISKLIKDALS